jgi:hypothetical protein
VIRSFEKLLSVVEAQINTPFLWRYARREDTKKEIAGCNDSLLRALALFTVRHFLTYFVRF